MSDLDQMQRAWATLFAELVDGAPQDFAFVLNPGDRGLLRSLDQISAEEASARPPDGGSSVAAHVDHLRYGFELLNRWDRGEENPWATANFAMSWTRGTVTDEEWRARRDALARDIAAWKIGLMRPRDVSDVEINGALGSVVHLAYHLGAIRQIARALRGPAASD